MKFGKLPAKDDPRTLRLGAYLLPTLPAPPLSFSILPRVEKATKVSDPRKLFPMDGNDRIGDCTIAAAAHAETIWEGMARKKRIPAASAVKRDYFHLTGGADTGLYELDVLNYWRQTGITGEKILAYAKIDVRNHDHVKQAITLFGGVYIGFAVQEGCVHDFNHRQVWTPAPLTQSGHAVYVYGYDSATVSVLTWGSTQKGTWDWWNECVDEVYSCLPGEASLAVFSPGINLDALKADLAEVAS